MSQYAVGELISGKYRIVRLIGDGGMGTVYEARHEVLGSGVALKFLHADLAKRPGLTQRFLQEARVSATIQSPHVTHVTDVDTAQDGSPYLVMELLHGQSLQAIMDHQGKLAVDQAVDFGLQILAGLEAAHAIGVVHRDLKPDNVFATPSAGGPLLKLIDFGIAKLRASSEYAKGLTRAGVVMGTPEYMAPEQLISAQTTDHRADIYSLGVMLFEMLSGLRPADGEDVELIIASVMGGRVRKLRDAAPGLPEGLVALVERATAPDREQRFESASAMRLALAQFAGHLSHAGRLAATSEPLQPAAIPASVVLSSLPSNIPSPGVPKTVPPDGPPLHPSQLAGARTSLSEGEPVMSPMARPMTGGTAIGGPSVYAAQQGYSAPQAYAAPAAYGVPAQYGAPATRPKSRSGLVILALLVVVVGGGGAVGYAAYQAVDRPLTIPQLPDVDAGSLPTGAETVERVSPDSPDQNPNGASTTGTPSTAPKTTGTVTRPSNTGVGGSTGTVSTGGSGGTVTTSPAPSTNGGTPGLQLPFPLPSTIQLPTLPPIQLPPGFSFPPGFPGLPQQAPPASPAPATPAPTPATPAPASPTPRPRQSSRP